MTFHSFNNTLVLPRILSFFFVFQPIHKPMMDNVWHIYCTFYTIAVMFYVVFLVSLPLLVFRTRLSIQRHSLSVSAYRAKACTISCIEDYISCRLSFRIIIISYYLAISCNYWLFLLLWELQPKLQLNRDYLKNVMLFLWGGINMKTARRKTRSDKVSTDALYNMAGLLPKNLS